jgi:oxalate decarboxylase/phosphoglucose isomerase-like protein (cupin superfamily)
VGLGRFLGVGEKDVAVPFTAIRFTENDGNRTLIMNAIACQDPRAIVETRARRAEQPR